VASPEQLSFLRGLAHEGVLPRWTEWFDDADVAALFPDAQTRSAVIAEQPRLPVAYYEQQIPAPSGWAALPCAYLWFGQAYEKTAAEAEHRGWPVRHMPGEHLHTIIDPPGVADEILSLAPS
jgi:hypothetical protein